MCILTSIMTDPYTKDANAFTVLNLQMDLPKFSEQSGFFVPNNAQVRLYQITSDHHVQSPFQL